jgi:hypothetical protein
MIPGVVSVVGGIFKELIGGIDSWFTSDEERLQAKTQIMMVQAQVMGQVLEYEKSIMEAQSAIIQAEAKGDSWIQRSWRPVTMLTFVALVVMRWLGLTDNTISEAIELQLMTLIQIGLGGYVVGRSAEKVVKAIDFGKIKAKD